MNCLALGKFFLWVTGFVVFMAAGSHTIGLAGTPGAYHPGETGNEQVRAAAAFAVQEEAKREGDALELKAIVKAEQQVVAGMNYRLNLQVNKGGETKSAEAVVFHGLDSHYELKAWHWLAP